MSNFNEISKNIWLIDNHKWALYCWEQYKSLHRDIPSALVHLDYHWDDCNYEGDVKCLKNMNLTQLYQHIEENVYILEDSFIVPAVIRGYLEQVSFYCFQKKEYSNKSIFLEYNVLYDMHDDISSLLDSVEDKEIILDLDLDIFNKSGDSAKMYEKGDLCTDKEITQFITACRPLIEQAKIITIAQSYGYTGSKEDIKHLTELIIPMILDIRNKE